MQILKRELVVPSPAWVVLACVLTVGVYWPGLAGPFLFDDSIHIERNEALRITDLAPASLRQAWHASPFEGIHSRPLAMLTFGLNHAFTGLDRFWLKLTNLGIHLINGLLVFALVRLIGRAGSASGVLGLDRSRLDTWAALTATLWLLHPMNLSSVLYTVQRMNSLSALLVLAAMSVYLQGRLRMLDGRPGFWPFTALSLSLGGLGVLAKENAVLLPGFLLLLEWIFLRFRAPNTRGRRQVVAFFVIVAGIPIVAAMAFLLVHPEWVEGGYAGRLFTFEERTLTEPRVLWFYLQNLLIPDYTQLGLYHDDFALSRSLTDPPSTLFALLGLAAFGLLALGLAWAGRMPVLAFGVLFFLVGHSLESSILPLEVIFEHRNYLPAVGILAIPAYALSLLFVGAWNRIIPATLAVVLVALLAANTALRTMDWRSETEFVLAEVSHHPDSPRANFQVGQQLITTLPKSSNPALVYSLARQHLERAVALRPANADGLFGLIVLNLYAGKQPEAAWIQEIEHRLRDFPYSAENVTTSQFSYLVRWHMQVPSPRLTPDQMLGIFDAVLANPRLDRYASAGIHSALRAYYDSVLKDPETAVDHARASIQAWPQHWAYHDRLIRLLVRLGRIGEAEKAMTEARRYASTAQLEAQADELQAIIGAGSASAHSNSTPTATP